MKSNEFVDSQVSAQLIRDPLEGLIRDLVEKLPSLPTHARLGISMIDSSSIMYSATRAIDPRGLARHIEASSFYQRYIRVLDAGYALGGAGPWNLYLGFCRTPAYMQLARIVEDLVLPYAERTRGASGTLRWDNGIFEEILGAFLGMAPRAMHIQQRITTPLLGVRLEMPSVDLDDNLSVRKLTVAELEDLHNSSYQSPFLSNATCAIETSAEFAMKETRDTRAKSLFVAQELDQRARDAVACVRLVLDCSADRLLTFQEIRSLTHLHMQTSHPMALASPTAPVSLSNEDVVLLKGVYKKYAFTGRSPDLLAA